MVFSYAEKIATNNTTITPELFTISSPSTVSPRYHGRYCVFYFSPFSAEKEPPI